MKDRNTLIIEHSFVTLTLNCKGRKMLLLFSSGIVPAQSLATLLSDVYINFAHLVLQKWLLALLLRWLN